MVFCMEEWALARKEFRAESRYRVAKTHSTPYLYRSFSTKVTYI